MKIFTSSFPKLSEGWTRGERDSMKRANRLRQKKEVIYDDPTSSELRQALIEGFCWWCKQGGFKAVANHTSHAHGITARNIRNLARLTSEESIATPEYSAFCQTRPQTVNCEKLLASAKHSKKTLSFTEEGLCRKRETGKKVMEKLNGRGIIPNPKGNLAGLRLAVTKHIQLLNYNPQYYKNWRKALSSTGRDKRIIIKCLICHKPFRTYKTSNRKTCGNLECIHKLRSNITRERNYRLKAVNREV